MRDDLLDAKAAIDWAVSDFPIFQAKIDAWAQDAPYTLFGDLDTKPGKKLIRLRNVKPIPDIAVAEAGIIVHAIRSSLDMLAVALAERNGATDPTDTYFPVWRDQAAFDNPTDENGGKAAAKKIKRLSAADQGAIKNLKPYKGGNGYIAALHTLDLTRKHRRLASAFVAPGGLTISGNKTTRHFSIPPMWGGFQNDSIIATCSPDMSESDLTLHFQIRFTEPSIVSGKPLIEVLNDFASLARLIVNMFDTPEEP
jgi:hypothetical protein